MSILGIDVGTSSTKCTLFEKTGEILYQTVREYDFILLPKERFEIEPMMIWNYIKEMILECSMKCNNSIAGIAVSSFGETAIYLDEHDKVVRNSFLYTDSRGNEELDEILRHFDEKRIKEITGVYPSKMYSIVKLLWIKNNEKENYATIKKVFQFTDFISYMLTGERVIDYSLATRTMAFNIEKLYWDSEILGTFDISSSLFSKPVDTGSIVGEVSAPFLKELKLHNKCKVFIGSQDQIASTVGAKSSSLDSASLGLGSVSCITAIYKNHNTNMGHYPILPVFGNYATYAFNFSGGSLIKWFTEMFAKDILDTTLFEKLEKDFQGTPSQIMVLPHFSGSGTPFMDREAQSIMYGMTLSTTRSEIYQAVLEGIAYELRYNIDQLVNLDINFDSLNITGGGSKSEVFCQILANITGKKISKLNITEAGTVGNFAYASVGLGIYKNFDKALENLVAIDKVYHPTTIKSTYKKQYSKLEKRKPYEFNYTKRSNAICKYK